MATTREIAVPVISIEDSPRFPWRGLMIDVGRHFIPLDVLKRNIDGMAAVKMNVLHWHLSDDQGFRVESKKFPKLTQAGSEGQFYTQDEIRDFIEADSLGYLSLEGMMTATGIPASEACVACWNERYPTRITSAAETMHAREESAAPRVAVEI